VVAPKIITNSIVTAQARDRSNAFIPGF